MVYGHLIRTGYFCRCICPDYGNWYHSKTGRKEQNCLTCPPLRMGHYSGRCTGKSAVSSWCHTAFWKTGSGSVWAGMWDICQLSGDVPDRNIGCIPYYDSQNQNEGGTALADTGICPGKMYRSISVLLEGMEHIGAVAYMKRNGA